MDGLGMIVRSDQGGIGAQSYELWQRLRPTQTLVVHLSPNQARGPSNWDRFCANWTQTRIVQTDVIPPRELRTWLARSERVLTIENMYSGDRGFQLARELGVATILIANPELYAGWSADRIAVPTVWEWGRMPEGTVVVPHPQNILPFRDRTEIRRFVHHWAPAMLDRNGTQIVMDALQYVRHDCDVHVHAPGRENPLHTDRVGCCRVTWNSEFLDDPWEGPGGDADCFVMPRRYGGQCLPAMEAAACSQVLLMSDTSPQDRWPIVRLSAYGHTFHRMKGGDFPVYDFNPRSLANRMNQLIDLDYKEVEALAVKTHEWVAQWDWPNVRERWADLCQ